MRDLTTAHKTQLAAKMKRVGLLVAIDYTPTPLYVWTGRGNISWDGKTWLGVGDLGSISVITEKLGATPGSLKLTINGVPGDKIGTALDDASAGRDVQVFIGTFTESGGVWSIVDAPNRMEWADTDVHEIVEGDTTCSIEVNCETATSRLTMRNVLRCTSEDQHRHFPDDTFFDFAEQVAEQVLYWPTPEPSAATGAARDGAGRGGQTVLN